MKRPEQSVRSAPAKPLDEARLQLALELLDNGLWGTLPKLHAHVYWSREGLAALRQRPAHAAWQRMHEIPDLSTVNPSHFKLDWWIYREGSEPDGAAFWSAENRMATRAAITLLEQLRTVDAPCLVKVRRRKRVGAGSPFVLSDRLRHPAPGYYEDPDPEWRGHR